MEEQYLELANSIVKPMIDRLSTMTNKELGMAREGLCLANRDNCHYAVYLLKHELIGMLSIEASSRGLKPEEWLV